MVLNDAYCHKDLTMRWVRAIAAFFSLAASGLSSAADTTNYAAAVEYIRCLATTYDLQREGAADLAQSKDATSKLMTSVRISTEANRRMQAMVSSLDQLEVGDDAQLFVGHLSRSLRQKIALNRDLIEIASKIRGGPQSGAEYRKLTRSGAQISAVIVQINEQISKLAHAFFAVMIDARPDEYGDVSHLKITRAQKGQLLKLIDDRFGASLDAENMNWTVRGAWIMRSNLRNRFKASDDHSPNRGYQPKARIAARA